MNEPLGERSTSIERTAGSSVSKMGEEVTYDGGRWQREESRRRTRRGFVFDGLTKAPRDVTTRRRLHHVDFDGGLAYPSARPRGRGERSRRSSRARGDDIDDDDPFVDARRDGARRA